MDNRAARLGFAGILLVMGGALTLFLLKTGPVDPFGSSKTGQEQIAAGRKTYEQQSVGLYQEYVARARARLSGTDDAPVAATGDAAMILLLMTAARGFIASPLWGLPSLTAPGVLPSTESRQRPSLLLCRSPR